MRILLTGVLLLLPLQAQALSCLAPSVARSYQEYDAAEERYLVVHGRVTLDQDLLPKNGQGTKQPPELTEVPGRLVGKSLSKEGFELPFEQDVTLEVACYGPWCGSVENGTDLLAFVRKDAEGYAIDVNPCGGAAFAVPKPEMLKQAKACMNGGPCEVPE
jgi:hypothetical protein